MSLLSNIHINYCFGLAKQALFSGHYPDGAIVTQGDSIIGRSNSMILNQLDPGLHSGVMALRMASGILKTLDLSHLTLYTAIEPSLLCLYTASWCNIRRIVYGCPKHLAVETYYESLSLSAKELSKKLLYEIELEQNDDFTYQIYDMHQSYRSKLLDRKDLAIKISPLCA